VLCAPVQEESVHTVANARVSYGSPDGRWDLAVFVDNLFEEEYRVFMRAGKCLTQTDQPPAGTVRILDVCRPRIDS
jgi:outer membrane receptor protein involved in Fe transport